MPKNVMPDLTALIDETVRRAEAAGDYDERALIAKFKHEHPDLYEKYAEVLKERAFLDLFQSAAKRRRQPIETERAAQLTLEGFPAALPGSIKFLAPDGKRRFVGVMRATPEQMRSHGDLQRENLKRCGAAVDLFERMANFTEDMGAQTFGEALDINAKRRQ